MLICDHVSSGGSIIDLAKAWGIQHKHMLRFLRGDPSRSKAYSQALEDRKEWAVERLLNELRSISTVDMTEVIDEDGTLLPTESWPENVKANLKKMVVTETFETIDKEKVWTGFIKTVEFHDKLKAIDLYGKQLKMWTDPADSGKGASLADLLVMGREMAKGLKE